MLRWANIDAIETSWFKIVPLIRLQLHSQYTAFADIDVRTTCQQLLEAHKRFFVVSAILLCRHLSVSANGYTIPKSVNRHLPTIYLRVHNDQPPTPRYEIHRVALVEKRDVPPTKERLAYSANLFP